MRKYAYLARLEELLAALPAQERQEALNYYEEYFDAAGNENEEKTAAELGDPAEVARKILEGEGIQPEEATPAPPEGEAAIPSSPAAPQPEVVPPPSGPEPPPLKEPEGYPTRGTVPAEQQPKPKPRRLWLIFWLLVALALVIQLAVLALGLSGGRGGQAASVAVEYAESAPASSRELAVEGPIPTDAGHTGLSGSGLVTYTAELQTSQRGSLYIGMNRGNVAFRTGEVGKIEVRNVDVSQSVTFTDNGSESSFLCESDDPATHVTVILPPNAYDSIQVEITGSGAVELGELQAEEINVHTADGPIQSGWVRAGTLTLQTDRGNIWLEKVTDGTGYHLENVKLLAPQGYVSFTLPGTGSQWNTKITNGEQYTKTTQASEPVQGITRYLEVEHGSSLKMGYNAT